MRRLLLGVGGGLVAGLALAACGVLGPQTLDVPPGHRVALGRIDLLHFDAPEVILELTREDGTFGREIVARGVQDFVLTMPPGRYAIRRLRTVQDGRVSPDHTMRYLRVRFEIGDAPVVYLGTLRLSSRIPPFVEVDVADEFDRTVPAFRARYPALDPPVRALFGPA